MKSISLIGPWPPPMGGVSIHVHRVRAALLEHHWNVQVWNESHEDFPEETGVRYFGVYLKLLPLLLRDLSAIFHAHTNSVRFIQIFPLFRLLSKNLILTVHGRTLPRILEQGTLNAKVLRMSISRLHAVVCVGEALFDELVSLGIPKRKLVLIPSYLPYKHEPMPALPSALQDFLDQNAGKPLLAANGAVRFVNGQDLYGLDQMIHMLAEPSIRVHDPVLVVYLSSLSGMNEKEIEFYDEMKSKVQDLGLGGRVYLHESLNDEFVALLQKASLMLRPTWSEGFGLSVLEAFSFACPVVASDAAQRQDACQVYRAGDVADFARVVDQVLSQPELYQKMLRDLEQPDYFAQLLSLYESFA